MVNLCVSLIALLWGFIKKHSNSVNWVDKIILIYIIYSGDLLQYLVSAVLSNWSSWSFVMKLMEIEKNKTNNQV